MTLQDKIVAEAERRFGELFDGTRQCGEFVREVLASQGAAVNGKLRDFGTEVDFQNRLAGDIIFLYKTLAAAKDNTPCHAAILTGTNKYIGQKEDTISARIIEFSHANGAWGVITDVEGNFEEYAIVRRATA